MERKGRIETMFRLAIDAMGGDGGAPVVIEGVLKAVQQMENVSFVLFGHQDQVDVSLLQHSRIEFIHTEEIITGEDEPAKVIRKKKNSSMMQMAQYVKEGKAHAGISAGNTGALMAAGIFIVGRIQGIERPALAPTLPTIDGNGFLLLDVGANIEAKTEHLVQYAQIGAIYCEKVRGIQNPRIGLVNIGTEAHKGTSLYQETYQKLSESNLNFVGNIEARELLFGVADVCVTDGFSGNQILKATEGTALALFQVIKEELMSSTFSKMGALLLKSKFRAIKNKMDYTEYGGAALFGLNAPMIKAHGSSDKNAFFHAIRQGVFMLENEMVEQIRQSYTKNK